VQSQRVQRGGGGGTLELAAVIHPMREQSPENFGILRLRSVHFDKLKTAFAVYCIGYNMGIICPWSYLEFFLSWRWRQWMFEPLNPCDLPNEYFTVKRHSTRCNKDDEERERQN